MSSDLQTARYDHLVRRTGGIIGPGSKVSEALPELFPVLSLEDLPGELLLVSDILPCFGGGQISSAAGQFATIQISNPAGSGKIVTVQSLLIGASKTTEIRTAVSTTTIGGAITTELLRDTRLGIATRPTTQIRTASGVAPSAANANIKLLAHTTFAMTDIHGIAILAPGTQWVASAGVAQLVLDFTFYWRERIALESELNFP